MKSSTDSLGSRIGAADVNATVSREDGLWVLTMTRQLRQPPERVWPMLVEPDQLVRWSPIVPDRPLDSPGPATTREQPTDEPVDAEVLVSNPPYELVHRWGAHQLRWTLEPTEQGTRLVLAHAFDTHDQRGAFAAGWHICLAVLTGVLDGDPVERIVGERALECGWLPLKERYEGVLT